MFVVQYTSMAYMEGLAIAHGPRTKPRSLSIGYSQSQRPATTATHGIFRLHQHHKVSIFSLIAKAIGVY